MKKPVLVGFSQFELVFCGFFLTTIGNQLQLIQI